MLEFFLLMFPLYQACFIMAFDRTRIVTNLIGNLCLQRQPNNRNQRAIQSRGLKKSIFCTARCNGKAPIHDSKRIQQCRHNSKKKRKTESSQNQQRRGIVERERERDYQGIDELGVLAAFSGDNDLGLRTRTNRRRMRRLNCEGARGGAPFEEQRR